MERSFPSMEKRDKIRYEVISCKTGVKDIRESAVHERTVGRTRSQNEQHRVGQNNVKWTPKEGKGIRGRPKRRWRDDIEEVVAVNG